MDQPDDFSDSLRRCENTCTSYWRAQSKSHAPQKYIDRDSQIRPIPVFEKVNKVPEVPDE